MIDPGKGLVAHGHVDPGLFIHNAAVMAEGFKACLAVI